MQPKSIPVPVTLAELIHSNNELLRIYRNELSNKVMNANIEMMQLIGLNPDEGWRLDMDTLTYVKVEADAPPVSE
jgi:hypothetical protein